LSGEQDREVAPTVELPMSEPPEERLWRSMRGALTARALALVAGLGVADALGEGSRPVAEVAGQVGADAGTLHRLLRALASEGVFAEEQPGVFRNTEMSALLRGPDWRASAQLLGGVWHRAAGELDASGNASFPRTFGADFWSWLAVHPDERGAFDRAMAGGKDDSAQRLLEVEWHDGDVVVDVGGGNGTLLVELLRRRPGLRGIVLTCQKPTATSRCSATRSSSSPAVSSTRFPAATAMSCPRFCITGPTNRRRRSSARSAPPHRRTRGC
jgi:O-methyltransferase domain